MALANALHKKRRSYTQHHQPGHDVADHAKDVWNLRLLDTVGVKDARHEECATENADGLRRCTHHCHDTQPDQNNRNVFRVIAMCSHRFFKCDGVSRFSLETMAHHVNR